MSKMEVRYIYPCECGWHGTKGLLVPETYENETLICCPSCNSVIYTELKKKEYDRRWLEIIKTKNKEDIANFCRKFKPLG